MPRGVRKTINYEERLGALDEKIAKLQQERKDLVQEKKEADMRTLTSFMVQNDLSPEDIIAAVTAKANAQSYAAIGEGA